VRRFAVAAAVLAVLGLVASMTFASGAGEARQITLAATSVGLSCVTGSSRGDCPFVRLENRCLGRSE
jgi:hypothetical protein